MRICNQCNLLSVGSGKFCPRCGNNTFKEVDDSTIGLTEELDYLAFVHGDDVLFEDRRLLSLLEDSFSATYLERIALKGAFRTGAVAMLSNWQTDPICFDSAYSVMMQEMSDTFSSLVVDAYRYVLVENDSAKHDVSNAVKEALGCSQDDKREIMCILARQIKELAMKKKSSESEAFPMHDISDSELITALNKTLDTLDCAAFSIEHQGYSVAQVDNFIDTLKNIIASVRGDLENKAPNYATLQIELNNCIEFISESTFEIERHGYATDKVQLLSQRITTVLSIINNSLANKSSVFKQESDTTSPRIDGDAICNHRIELDDEPLPRTPTIANQIDNLNNADGTYSNEAKACSDEEDVIVNDWSDVWKTF